MSSGSYDPKTVEREIYAFWETEGVFHDEADRSRRSFSVVIPPPNVTGALHMGHALNNTLQDILIRRARMKGYATAWIPGTDHAGIATQAVVEKRLRQEDGLSRHELGRDGLVERIWAWKDQYNERIINQLRAIGCSCDWQRTRFTLDETCQRAVYETFFRFFKDGKIFRGLRLVNWDAALQTAVADDEIIHETVKGHLWSIRYPLEGGDATKPDAQAGRDYLVVATTRPETMLGDTAVAVHPEDERYQHLIGKRCRLPLVDRPIPIIADGLLVRREFGTGCVKVTPGHDPNDYACGQRNGLRMINILTVDGRINENGGAYAELDRYAARKQIVADLEAQGLLDDVQPHENEVGHSDRSKTPIEPMLSEQWFVQTDRLAENALEAVRDGRVRFFPSRYAKTYLDWLGEKRDWCISRQLWWGHRIPVWKPVQTLDATQRRKLADKLARLAGDHPDELCVRAEQEALYVCIRPTAAALIAKVEALGFEQDPDVLDTWFSSALWPHSTLGWPTTTPDLEAFYPTEVLCTARDIISLWVARMVMTGLYNVGRVPFAHVYIHPVIQDGDGRRMSKSLGNGVDPMDLVDMFGADAMRFTLAQLAGETQDIRLPVKRATLPDGREVNTSDRFEQGRNFCNKLWQAATGFVIGKLSGYAPRPLTSAELALEDQWILSRLSACIASVEQQLNRYHFNDATNTLYAFFWNDFCDWYIELVKPRLFSRSADGELADHDDDSAKIAKQVLAWVLDQVLRLLHPTVPFVTEALWREINQAAPVRGILAPTKHPPALIGAPWPQEATWPRDAAVEREMGVLVDVIRAFRDIRTRVNTIRAAAKESSIKSLPAGVIKAGAPVAERLTRRTAVIQRLGNVDALDIGPDVTKPAEAASIVHTDVEVYVALSGLADLKLERQRLQKERNQAAAYIKQLRGKLSNEKFVSKAPPAVVDKERDRLAELEQKLDALDRNLAEIADDST